MAEFAGIETGREIYVRLAPEMTHHPAEVVSAEGNIMEILLHGPEITIEPGALVVVSDPDREVDYYAEVLENRGSTIRLGLKWTGRRSYFRVDDMLPLSYRRLPLGDCPAKSRLFTATSGKGTVFSDTDIGSIDPVLLRILREINDKLETILSRLDPEQVHVEKQDLHQVNISASGVRFIASEQLDVGDTVEVTLRLPLSPPVWLRACGKVVRTRPLSDRQSEIALHFLDMDEDALDAIVEYTLKRQRELIREKRLANRKV